MSLTGPVVKLFLLFLLSVVSGKCHYTNEWAVEMTCGTDEAAKVARQYGFHFVNQVMEGVYMFRHHKVSRRSLERSEEHHRLLADDTKVVWLEQQQVKTRVKRDFFIDPDWPQQWYMNRGENLDMNVLSAYKRFGATGEGVVVTIMDDGVEKNHTDLRDNYDPKASYDFNDSDDDPQPRYDFTDFNRHGTRCAGEVAAVANNSKCGVGIAYKAKIGGLRMLDGDVTDVLEASSISFNSNHIHIYSASWGPTDDGKTLDGPGKLATMAFEKGIREGRGGLGSIFVWASGNGGRDEDNCNCDGYTNNMYTLSISSASESGKSPYYSERCSSTLATTYSSGLPYDRQIVTTDLHDLCTSSHSGTSASAPLAAGIVALALQINPDLTWRDMQYIVVFSSRKANLQTDDWIVNGAGRLVSHSFGFGLMDAAKMVKLAKNWERVPKQQKCVVQLNFEQLQVLEGNQTEVTVDVDGCQGTSNEINYLEHVQSYVTLSVTDRGQSELFLISPNQTVSELVRKRPKDKSTDGFTDWPFMSTHHWGEQPRGTWQLRALCGNCNGTLKNWTLVLYGTKTDPVMGSGKSRILKSDEKICNEDEFLLNDFCYGRCPAFYYPSHDLVNITTEPETSTEIINASTCLPCHYSCEYCMGPSRYNCTSCTRGLLTPDKRCIYSNEGLNIDARILIAVCLSITVLSIIISIVVARLLTRYCNKKDEFNFEQSEPLLNGS